MKTLSLEKYGDLASFKVIHLPERVPGAGEVRVKVHASALNPADYKVALGEVKFLHGRKFPLTLGYDFSGEVAAVGPGVTDRKSVV